MQTIHLDANMVPASLRGSYAGKKFKARDYHGAADAIEAWIAAQAGEEMEVQVASF